VDARARRDKFDGSPARPETVDVELSGDSKTIVKFRKDHQICFSWSLEKF
jgi:hypothetical protein